MAKRDPGIDALRGVAILLVVLHHTGLRIPLKHTALLNILPLRLLNALNYNGYESVFVFFVISGFLIASNALKRWGKLDNIALWPFYARRFSRIVPCLFLLVVVLGALHLSGVDGYVIHRAGQSLSGATFAAFGLYLNWYEGHFGYLPGGWDVLWSLSIEELFYLGFPLVCLLTRRSFLLAPLLLIFALTLPWTHAALADNEIWQEKAYLPGMAAIATGVLGALVAAHWHAKPWTIHLMGCVGALGLCMILFVEDWLWPVFADGTMLVLTFSVLCLVLACDQHFRYGVTRPLRGFGWLRSWGRLSYEIYLSHMFVVTAVVRLYKSSGADNAYGFLWYLAVVPLCWVLGRAVERFISTPCEQWLRARWLKRGAIAVPVKRSPTALHRAG